MFRKYFCTLAFCLLFCFNPASSQGQIKELPSGYYMTVAAYLSTGEGYAIRYVNKLKDQGHKAEYGFTYKKNMYFVYIKHYGDFNRAINEINSTRKNTPFDDAWVYAYTALNPKPEQPIIEPVAEEKTKTEELNVADLSVDYSANEDSIEAVVAKDSIEVVAEADPPEEVVDDGSRLIYFETVHSRTHEPVDIEFTLFTPSNKRVISSMQSREVKRISPPINQDQSVYVTTNTFGWIKDEINFNFSNPITDSTENFARLLGDTLVLFFDMHRMHTGDVQALFNVYFFNESAIMLSHSNFQLAELLSMLKENNEYRIKLHGHTNGSASGSYSRLAEGDTIFFKMSKLHELTEGSAKALSFDRANTVKQYLISQGISDDRIEVKGWGGKKMIHDENSAEARRNIRVEVEVLKDK